MKVFSGSSHPELSQAIVEHLGVDLEKIHVSSFADGEVDVELGTSVRGVDAVVLQSTCSPVNDLLMELIAIVDALKRASAKSVTLVMPYFGYARQDRRIGSARIPIMAKVVADMLAAIKVDRILIMDMHSEVMQGFFSMPIDNMYATPIFIEDILHKKLTKMKVVSPDVGGVVRARALAKKLGGSDLAIIDKRRDPQHGTQTLHTIGDVNGYHCILIDDLLDTGKTLMQAAKALKASGALSVLAYVTHPVCTAFSPDELMLSDVNELIFCNTIPLRDDLQTCSKIRTMSVAPLIADVIQRVFQDKSLGDLFL